MKNALEIVTYKIKDGVMLPEFLKASAELEEGFAKKQEGFLSRTFAKAEGNEWIDVIRWQSMADAEAASKAACRCADAVTTRTIASPGSRRP